MEIPLPSPQIGIAVRRWVWVSLMVPALTVPALAAPVSVRETTEVIPTYLAAPPSPIPRFYSGRTYQGAKATFYPYPVQDQLTDIKTNKTYKMVYLENDYIKIGVLPEIGGRIFSAVDKSNGYNFFYRQHVIKPALIGMLGAWISGGVEWNVPHHHRASSFMPVEYTTMTNADGSATIWVGETELRHRMRWLVGMTLYPDRSYLELNCKVFNRTPFAQSMLFWINPAVHANTNYQVIFPPSTEWVVQHAKPEFASWPIAQQVYGGTDYTRGVDISWWKNHPSPVSFFAWNYEDDWFGGYDHGKQAGVLQVSDHNVAPGKKFFEWGNGPEGEMWSKVLTDDDGPYLELMAGAWSDNQPDYSWIQPGETREWKHWWYPIRDMGGVKAANVDAAVNLEIVGDNVRVSAITTRPITGALLQLQGKEPGESEVTTWFKTNITVSPEQAWSGELPMKKYFIQPTNITVQLFDSVSLLKPVLKPPQPLISYQILPRRNTPIPKPVERPKNPKDYTSLDELYFTGQRIEQLYSPSFEAASYYQEILRRDPGDYRANTAMGIMMCKQWRWEEAENYLRTAIGRSTANYIRPRDGEAFYYLGVALRGQVSFVRHFSGFGPKSNALDMWQMELKRAAEPFQKALWYAAWASVSHQQLAEIACLQEDYQKALQHIEQSISSNDRNPKALILKSAILRKVNRLKEAVATSVTAQQIDPLNMGSALETYLVALEPKDEEPPLSPFAMKRHLPKEVEQGNLPALLELIVDYGNAGFRDEAARIAWKNGLEPTHPMLHYYAGFYGPGFMSEGLHLQYGRALTSEMANAFPYQYEFIEVLEEASIANRAPGNSYYLGNLLYDTQPERAIKEWEKAIANVAQYGFSDRSNTFAFIHRNLGLAYAQHQKDIPKAIVSLENAVQLNSKEPRFLYELDVQNEAGGTAVKRRLQWLTAQTGVAAQRDDSLTRLILVYLADGQLDKALEILTTHRFHNWEGSSDIRNIYVDARLMRGQQHLRAKRAAEALKDFEAAQEFPANLEVGRPRRDAKTAQINYHIALAHEALGNANKAKEFFTQASTGRGGGGGATEASFYRALAMQKGGRADDAKPIFESLVKQGQELQTSEPADYFAKFGEKRAERVRKADAHYLSGLGYLGLGKKPEADAEFKKALELHPAHLGVISQTPY